VIAVVLQARMGSTRLPGKSLLPLGGSSLVEQAMARLSLVGAASLRVLATDEASAPALAPAAERRGFELLVGPAEDVLARYCLAIRRYGPELVVRATGDNPLVSFELAALLIERRRARASDYAGYVGMRLGMGVELVSSEALLRAEAEAREPSEREHVCPYLYRHPELFRVDRPEAPAAYLAPGARLTVDTAADYESMLRLYGALYDGRPIPSAAALEYLRGGDAIPKAGTA
jgi:spore coat polysaccharide biosynthesis protein SpsF